MTQTDKLETGLRWYQGVSRAQWIVLAIASAGWVFDVFEGQIFVASMNRAMDDLLGAAASPENKRFFSNVAFAAFLLGGAVGGLLFGTLADRIGRRRTMMLTILMYSLFTGVTYFAQHWWDLAILRFFVAMGVGGEWAVAAAAVAEVFPPRSRPAASGIFHASSVLGTYLAVAAGATVVVASWRYGFLLGLAPALLVIWVRMGMVEPESWQVAQKRARQLKESLGSFRELFGTPPLRRHTLVGTGLATIGMATFWGVHVYGKDLVREEIIARYVKDDPRMTMAMDVRRAVMKEHQADIQRWEMLGMFLVTTGGGLGLLAFAPLSGWTNRRRAFLFYHLGGFVIVLLTCQLARGLMPTLIVLPVFGFLTLGMHAGYAVYFPELFPTRLRGSGGGFCFNVGRIIAAPVVIISGAIQKAPFHLDLRTTITLMGLLFFLGAGLLAFAPETKDKPLPE
jgi:hypothetical protein